MTEEEFNALCKMYASEDRADVLYVDFINETNPFVNIQ